MSFVWGKSKSEMTPQQLAECVNNAVHSSGNAGGSLDRVRHCSFVEQPLSNKYNGDF